MEHPAVQLAEALQTGIKAPEGQREPGICPSESPGCVSCSPAAKQIGCCLVVFCPLFTSLDAFTASAQRRASSGSACRAPDSHGSGGSVAGFCCGWGGQRAVRGAPDRGRKRGGSRGRPLRSCRKWRVDVLRPTDPPAAAACAAGAAAAGAAQTAGQAPAPAGQTPGQRRDCGRQGVSHEPRECVLRHVPPTPTNLLRLACTALPPCRLLQRRQDIPGPRLCGAPGRCPRPHSKSRLSVCGYRGGGCPRLPVTLALRRAGGGSPPRPRLLLAGRCVHDCLQPGRHSGTAGAGAGAAGAASHRCARLLVSVVLQPGGGEGAGAPLESAGRPVALLSSACLSHRHSLENSCHYPLATLPRPAPCRVSSQPRCPWWLLPTRGRAAMLRRRRRR